MKRLIFALILALAYRLPVVRQYAHRFCPYRTRGSIRMTVAEMSPLARQRFPHKVEKVGDCWIWTGGQNGPGGYGIVVLHSLPKQKRALAHRIAYEWYKGPIPAGLVIDHLCRTPACVNPEHLEAVTQGENTLRGWVPWVVARRAGVCGRGHSLMIATESCDVCDSSLTRTVTA